MMATTSVATEALMYTAKAKIAARRAANFLLASTDRKRIWSQISVLCPSAGGRLRQRAWVLRAGGRGVEQGVAQFGQRLAQQP
jgi:hypothetical protein